ncbi:DUF4153 domain-containing protein [Mucilaginibacter pallidiroseus]|uniref:DUF4153 domain-containing protein n=1 Tax=Mucilaginibacter pallidiroseus TaxID=2599295 RepID=A0A563UEW6_9SPHI|nr:DUF4153 domain-containing protein [Mucilaginibacter pallidiroseus]TWR29907.1 DUF4153 domain-containing protein [Mucilaginibacter pallidiroseus]
MRFPSVKNLADSAVLTLRRFPFEVAFALTGTIAAIVKIELTRVNRISESWCTRTIMMANLGLLLSLGATLYTESREITGGRKIGLRALAALIGIALIFIINPAEREADYVRFLLLSLALHLLVAYAGFTKPGHIQGFWQFNRTLFLQSLTAVLYSGVLFAGLAGAIGAMNFLFNFEFEWDTFAILFACIAGLFNTIFFLSGVPANLQALDRDLSYPKGLKIFTQYVLIPLATVYVSILLAYEARILILWALPKGLVSNLILGYAVFGILALLLVYPIRDHEENKWLKSYTRSFYFLLIPLLGLLFVAAGTRIFKYGITEKRYFLLLLACWLLFITIMFLVRKNQNIKLIPISLSLLTLLSIYGPQSAFSVAEYSQKKLLVDIFKKNNAFKDGKLIAVDSLKISKKEGSRAVATLNYLVETHDLESLQPYFSRDLQKVSDSISNLKDSKLIGTFSNYELRYRKFDWAKKELGLNSFNSYYYESDTVVTDSYVNYTFTTNQHYATVVKGFDYLLDEGVVADTVHFKADGLIATRIKAQDTMFTLNIDGSIFLFDLGPVIKNITAPAKMDKYVQDNTDHQFVLPVKDLTLIKSNDRFEVQFVIDQINVGKEKGKAWEASYVHGSYLVKKR